MCAQVQDMHQLLLLPLNHFKTLHIYPEPQNISHLPTFLPLLTYLNPRYHPWHPGVKSNPTSSCISLNALQLIGVSVWGGAHLSWKRGRVIRVQQEPLEDMDFFWDTACMEAFISCGSVKYFYEGIWEQPIQYSSSTMVCPSQFGNPRFREFHFKRRAFPGMILCWYSFLQSACATPVGKGAKQETESTYTGSGACLTHAHLMSPRIGHSSEVVYRQTQITTNMKCKK